VVVLAGKVFGHRIKFAIFSNFMGRHLQIWQKLTLPSPCTFLFALGLTPANPGPPAKMAVKTERVGLSPPVFLCRWPRLCLEPNLCGSLFL